jgi:membrane protein
VPRKAIVKYVVSRLLSLALIAAFGFLLLVSLVLDTALVAFGERLKVWFSEMSVFLIAGMNIALSFTVIASVFALVFKLLPDARVKWRDVRSGALLTAVLFTLGKYLIGLYIGTSQVDDAYGAAGTVIVILLWVYFSAVILLFGAQFTYQVAQESGRHIRASEHAVVEHHKQHP